MKAAKPTPLAPSHKSINRHVLAGVLMVALLAGGVGGWAATSEISGAVIAAGQLETTGAVAEVHVAHDPDRLQRLQVAIGRREIRPAGQLFGGERLAGREQRREHGPAGRGDPHAVRADGVEQGRQAHDRT